MGAQNIHTYNTYYAYYTYIHTYMRVCLCVYIHTNSNADSVSRADCSIRYV